MRAFRPLSATEQLAAHLRSEIESGTIGDALPGVHRLAKELGVGPRTVVAAVAQLEHEGLVQRQGPRRRCRIVPASERNPSGLKMALLPYETSDRMQPYLLNLQHRLQEAGHRAEFTSKTLIDLRRDPKRIADFVRRSPADAWIVFGGSQEILEWFAAQPKPAFALFGRRRAVPIAGVGPDKQAAMREVVRRLTELGHRRIVLLAREERRKPRPGALERTFLEELAKQGVATGSYHLPEWQETPEGFQRCLDLLFDITPPTALLLDEAFFLHVAQQHLARRGIHAPEQVSLICSDPDPSFAWFRPRVAHIHWDTRPVVRRVVRWVDNVTHGRKDGRQTLTRAEFIEGGSVGPAPRSR